MTENTDVDLKDRVVFYYNLLKNDLSLAQKIIAEEEVDEINNNAFDPQKEMFTKISTEFNSLSVIYRKPQEKFLKDEVLKILRKAEKHKGDQSFNEETVKEVK